MENSDTLAHFGKIKLMVSLPSWMPRLMMKAPRCWCVCSALFGELACIMGVVGTELTKPGKKTNSQPRGREGMTTFWLNIAKMVELWESCLKPPLCPPPPHWRQYANEILATHYCNMQIFWKVIRFKELNKINWLPKCGGWATGKRNFDNMAPVAKGCHLTIFHPFPTPAPPLSRNCPPLLKFKPPLNEFTIEGLTGSDSIP